MTQERPAGILPEWQLYQPKLEVVDGEQREIGFRDGEEKYWPFDAGESLANIQNDEGGRTTYVKLANGTLVPVNLWKSEQGR